ncbi:MAG: Toxin RelG [Tenericutes bacterium ADurb.BinA155]|jgi:mRNA interferase RelE/StbE|nr:MAG: Toxin RelG [Tenericutes bacterium ADurb.BinA155]
MAYKLRFAKSAIKDLTELDPPLVRAILRYLHQHVEMSDNPRVEGKALKGKLAEYWRYRIGDYRVLCVIQDNILTVLVIKAGHRKDIYR